MVLEGVNVRGGFCIGEGEGAVTRHERGRGARLVLDVFLCHGVPDGHTCAVNSHIPHLSIIVGIEIPADEGVTRLDFRQVVVVVTLDAVVAAGDRG